MEDSGNSQLYRVANGTDNSPLRESAAVVEHRGRFLICVNLRCAPCRWHQVAITSLE